MENEPIVIENEATVNEVVTSPVFNSLEEMTAWNEANANKQEQSAQPKVEEVEKTAPVIINKESEQPPLDIVSLLKGSLGDEYDSVEKVKAALSKSFEIPEDLKPFVEDAKLYRDKPQLLEWMRLADKGVDVDLAYRATKLDVSKLEPKDALILDLVFNSGLTKEEATAVVEQNHKVAFGSEDDYEANEKLAANAAVKLQSQDAKKRLEEFQQKVRLPEPERKALADKATVEQREKERISAWKPEVKKIADSVSVAMKGEYGVNADKISVDFNYSFDEKDKESFAKIVESIVANPNYEYSKENSENVKQLAEAIFYAQKREAIMHSYAQKVIEQRDAYWGKKAYGIDTAKGGLPDTFTQNKTVVQDTRKDSNYGKW